MTEAYVTGFCKVAEEYGIDPKELLKFAAGKWQDNATLRTDGWAPRTIPYEYAIPALFSLGVDQRLAKNPSTPVARSSERVVDMLQSPGVVGNWWRAHTAAQNDASNLAAAMATPKKNAPATLANRLRYAVTGRYPQVPANSPEVINAAAATRYHDNMYAITNGVPSIRGYRLLNRAAK